MSKVRTQFDEHERYITEPGNRFLQQYQEEIGKDGQIKIVKTNLMNIYEIIQSHLEETKIENILHAVAMGDLSALQQREAVYCDATTMPKTLMEAQNLVIKAKAEFEKMPIEVRKLFNNSPEQYVSEMGTKEFLDKMAPYNNQMKEIQESGSMKEYQKKVAAQAKFEKDVAAAKEVKTE